jgi:hypothetical protein
MMVSLPSCSESPTEPPAPPPPEAQPPDVPVDQGQVTIYERPNYEGEGYTLRGSILDLATLPGPCSGGNWNNCISSIRVSPGWRVDLWERPNAPPNDLFLPLYNSIANLGDVQLPDGGGDWDDAASSIGVTYEGAASAATGGRRP